ncbi:LysR family transcriptional regulator [Ralstonia pseudosolanacearum]|uniref:LysR family transcriptional regulator n=1 Tax=Ralstonia pseudosolanacearum TaxID=1310165 RepID=UPI0018665773|nr:LysR family transcriptional regulator [Ralstonia pseudosolanacearum]QOK92202.1 LysR family transcriptional regulator [Ralstonia pseudosolanacearum]
MESLANLESFVRSAESGSFSAAARRLALTPAAVSRNVAQLERNLGVQLFQRSTRGLTPTEAGDRFLLSVRSGLDSIQGAIADLMVNAAQPSGVLKLSVPAGFGMDYLLPLMPAFLKRHPAVRPDWYFDNRPVDLIGDGFDVAIGGGFDLPPGMVARELGRIHLIAAASPTFLEGKRRPNDPADLADFGSVAMRSPLSSRQRAWVMRNTVGAEMAAVEKPVMLVNDPDALCRATLLGIGIGLVSVPHATPHLASGALVRLLPDWHVDVGPLSLYFSNQKLLPAKTRAFVDFVTEAFRAQKLPNIEAIKSSADATVP